MPEDSAQDSIEDTSPDFGKDTGISAKNVKPEGSSTKNLWKRDPLVERSKRSRRGLIYKLNTLASQPKLFISLTIDRRQHRNLTAKEVKAIFKKFKRYMSSDYPGGWFIYKIEWEVIAGLHVHMIGDTGKKIRLDITKPVIKSTWDLCCKHTGRFFKSVETQIYKSDGAKSYFSEQDKFKQEIICAEKLGRMRMYGCINPKNIKYMEPEHISMSSFEYTLFHEWIIKELEKEKSISFYERQFIKESATMNFIHHELLTKFLSQIKRLRKKILGSVYKSFSESQYHAYRIRKMLSHIQGTG